MRFLLFLLLGSLAVGNPIFGSSWVEEAQLAPCFTQQGVEGCFVVLDPLTDTLRIYNPERARQRFKPASTFKIPNALIGLDIGAIRDVQEVIPYGGTSERLKVWEQDMSLQEAMKVSNVAVFHQLAKRIGLERMVEKVARFRYGNAQLGTDITQRFWLKGPLEISAVEQVDFLRRLINGELPLKPETVKAVRSLILYETALGRTVYAKTGWVGPEDPQLGWWVGWVEKAGHSYPFALNMVIKNREDAKRRLPIAQDCLRKLGFW